MQFFWPIKAQYVIAFVDEQYSQTIVARDKRDHVWIMAPAASASQVIDYGWCKSSALCRMMSA